MTESKDSFTDVLSGIGGAFRIAFALITPFLRHHRTTWGAAPDEIQRALPGDELNPTPKWSYTTGITIHASAAKVWRWLIQLGQGRGGFYSYQWLENLVGCQIYNAETIHPEWQNIQVGDRILLHPKAPALPVAIVDPERAVVLHANAAPNQTEGAPDQEYFNSTWGFYVFPIDDHTSRFISRWRADYANTRSSRMMYGPTLIEPISATMQREMLLGIKKRAEQH